MTRSDHQRIGALGERLAADHLRRDVMRVLDRNWRCRAGELDIVAADASCVVFCEVKTRRSVRFGGPLSAVTTDKANRLKRLAKLWQRERRPRSGARRFDVVCVWLSRDERFAAIRHRKGAL
ncbi:YraN family protein [Stackebrandtia soli]|uniref:YraN family protein n=1 Tax=Stackebrandtia soli TaxID=1892856 RepID=UPI0039ECE495